jgi:C4-dicarboxylate-specific signal transduction histidine kinase
MNREEMLVRRLADHYCSAYLVAVIEGIIHNLNGPFQILYIRAEQLAMNTEDLREASRNGDSSEMEDIIDKLAERTRSILTGLDELNNQHHHLTSGLIVEQRSVLQPIKVNDLIKDTTFLLNANMFFKHKVEKTNCFDEDLPTVFGLYSEFGAMILALVQNALEAMADSEEKRLEIETSHKDNMVTIRVKDTGCGIPQEYADEIFNPFFTTKKGADCEPSLGENIGLGLSLVNTLIKGYNGTITCESAPGATTFTLNVPAGDRKKD